jgi:hypothetical protein
MLENEPDPNLALEYISRFEHDPGRAISVGPVWGNRY